MKNRLLPKQLVMALILMAAVLAAYGNSLQCSWQYDDFSNILENGNVKLTSFTWQQLKRAMYDQHIDSRPTRPLARLSFALNYYWGRFRVQGYHVVNIIVHLLTALTLWRLAAATLERSPVLAVRRQEALVTGWLAALFWAVHPIQVTAVTYIVQRMASMAAFFYLASMLFFLEGRTAATAKGRVTAFSACVLCGAAAVACKENAFMLPVSLMLFDLVLLSGPERKIPGKRVAAWSALIAVVAAAAVWFMVDPDSVAGPWENRPFTLGQRLLTQPGVIWRYLGLLALPAKTRLCLLHDVEISRGIFTPPTTLPAIVSLGGLVALLMVLCRKKPLVGFAGLFFLLNHLIEGSVFNLELFYEHRNYLPSAWLFVVLASFAVTSWKYFEYKKWLQWAVAGCCAVWLGSQIHTTAMYNRVFKSELSLWMDVVAKSPRMSLAHNNLGKILWNAGLHEKAHEYFLEAFRLDRYNDLRQKGLVYYNLGLYELEITKDYAKAKVCFQRAAELASGMKQVWYQLGQACLLLHDPGRAEVILRKALQFWPDDCGLRSRLMLALAKQPGKRYAAAVLAGELAERCPGDPVPIACLADLHQGCGRLRAALAAWKRLERFPGQERYALMGQIEVFARLNRTEQMKAAAERLLRQASPGQVKAWLDELLESSGSLPHVPDRDLILEVLEGVFGRDRPPAEGE